MKKKFKVNVRLANKENLIGDSISMDRNFFRLNDEYGHTEIPKKNVTWIRHFIARKK